MIIMQELIIIVEDSKTLFCFSKFPRARERISSKFINDLDTRLQKDLSILPSRLILSDVEQF
jgi:hypothetical protein